MIRVVFVSTLSLVFLVASTTVAGAGDLALEQALAPPPMLAAITPLGAPTGRTPPRRPAGLPALYAASALLQGFDAYSTLRALEMGGAEANPMMQAAATRPVVLIAVKAAVTAASIVTTERLWKAHHRADAIAVMVATNGFMALMALHNAGVIDNLRR